MPPKPFRKPDLSTQYDEPIDIVARTVDNILLSEDDFTKIERTPSGSLLTTRKSATPDELTEAKRTKRERRRASNLASGAADIDGSYEEGLELTSEPRPAFSQPSDTTTTRINN